KHYSNGGRSLVSGSTQIQTHAHRCCYITSLKNKKKEGPQYAQQITYKRRGVGKRDSI
ncbi:unnamed protein product, partial [Amoebophrya sp. A120]